MSSHENEGGLDRRDLRRYAVLGDGSAAITGGTPEARALGAKMADAWIAFARKSDPNQDR